MAQVKPEYQELPDFLALARQIVEKFPEVFSQLNVDTIKCVAITNKERSEKKPLWEVKPVPMPIKLDCLFSYYVIVYISDWVELDEKHKLALVADALHAIPIDDEKEGKCNPLDFKGFGTMVRTLGMDFMERGDIPNLLTDDIKWNVR